MKLSLEQRQQRKLARFIFSRARTRGRIRPMPDNCERCGVPNDYLQAHHTDYSKPLEIRWLCRSCHPIEDRMVRYELPEDGHAIGQSYQRIDATNPPAGFYTLRQARKLRRLTQEQLAALMSVNQSHVSALERSPDVMPAIRTLKKLGDALGLEALFSLDAGLVFEEKQP